MEANSMAPVFNRAGYDTMRTCKKGDSFEGANKQFTVRRDASKRGGTEETGSAWHGKQVLDYLNEREAAKDKDPFLIYYGFSYPHDVRDGTSDLLGNAYLLDVLATICDFAGVKVPSSSEGVGFRPVLEGKKDIVRDVLYETYSGGTKPGMRCVKKEDWKLIKYDVMGPQGA